MFFLMLFSCIVVRWGVSIVLRVSEIYFFNIVHMFYVETWACNNNNSRYLIGRRVGRGREDGVRRDRRFYAHSKYIFILSTTQAVWTHCVAG